MPTVSKLTKAKVALVIDQPFFATVLMKLKLIERTDLPTKTMATDGLNIYYDKVCGGPRCRRVEVCAVP